MNQVTALLGVPESSPDGGILIIPRPDDINELLAAILNRPNNPVQDHPKQDSAAKKHPNYAFWKKSKRDFMEFFIPLALADLQPNRPKTWRDLVDEATEELKGLGITTHDLQTYRRYIKKEFRPWYDQKVAWEKGNGPHPEKLF